MQRPKVIVRHSTVPIPELPEGLDGLKIAHVSDCHFTHWNRLAVTAQQVLLSLKFDLLLVTGDFTGQRRRWARAAIVTRRFFEPFYGRIPIYAVLGNHDESRLADIRDMPMIFLRNECVTLKFAQGSLHLAGLDQSIDGSESLDQALFPGGNGVPTILMAHYPSTVYRLGSHNVALMLSGHTHGGQIRVPGLGCLWPNDRVPRELARGLHVVGETTIHVSAGLGTSPPIRIRVNCPPEVGLLDLRRTEWAVEPSTVGAPGQSQRNNRVDRQPAGLTGNLARYILGLGMLG